MEPLDVAWRAYQKHRRPVALYLSILCAALAVLSAACGGASADSPTQEPRPGSASASSVRRERAFLARAWLGEPQTSVRQAPAATPAPQSPAVEPEVESSPAAGLPLAPQPPAPATPVEPEVPSAVCVGQRVLTPVREDLLQALRAAADAWAVYLGCQPFAVASLATVAPLANADGVNAVGVGDGDESAAATTWRWDPVGEYDVVIEDDATNYDWASVLMHELGHVLGYGHEGGPLVMNPSAWHGPETVFSGVDG